MKKWVRKTDLLIIRPADAREMSFAKPGDMIIERDFCDGGDFLLGGDDFKESYVEVEVPGETPTSEQKVLAVISELSDIDPEDMTDAELKIRDIIHNQKATTDEKRRAKLNTSRLS